MRVLVLGATGMLGHDLIGTAPPGIALFPFSRAQLDITVSNALAATVKDAKPDVIINAAAYTAVDKAESDPGRCYSVNLHAVGELGRIAVRNGAAVAHVSTDYVFDGEASQPYTESSQTHPMNVYGASKLAGEEALLRTGATSLIVRTQWLFGLHGRSFPYTMWERALAGSRSSVVADQFGRPTYTVDLAHAIWKLIAFKVRGVVNVANIGVATWYEVARRVYSATNATELVHPCATADFVTPARRPRWSVLDTARFEAIVGSSLPTWQDGLDRFLRCLHAAARE